MLLGYEVVASRVNERNQPLESGKTSAIQGRVVSSRNHDFHSLPISDINPNLMRIIMNKYWRSKTSTQGQHEPYVIAKQHVQYNIAMIMYLDI